ncbi:purine-nucleoside phosphorylase [Actinomyces naeslundii]|uniref:purine-nucleoside phosphorylase n=1 Tax=Actinomyces naeslundii TaxID=1655 RepID=A0A854D9N4_ACTNA|nr:purine-nucleoside phosphorylase [Actinomyces naeslundii]OMG42468.1 purine-nucleoside phosphorylase [Actinomyces naeslundii]
MEALGASAGAEGPGPALEGAHQIARRTGAPYHDLLVVLGSGAADALAAWGEPEASLRLSDLPGVLAPVAPGHDDRLDSYVVGRDQEVSEQEGGGERRVLVARGRSHLYEGHGPRPVVALARIAAAAGVRGAVLVNAGGCLRSWRIGEVMTITDHLNLTGSSPFDGPVFTDMRSVWDGELAGALGSITARSGVYAALRGPEYQTVAESRMLADLGADCVGMSTVMEAIVLHRLGVRVAGMSIVSDLSFAQAPTDPDEVVRLAAAAHATIAAGIETVLAAMS